MEDLKNQGSKGRFVMWVLIIFILLISVLIWVYKMNFKGLP
jgi:hypothetical protein